MTIAGKMLYEFDARRFGDHLRQIREQRKKTMAQVAETTGVFKSQVNLVEKGRQGMSKVTFCLAIWAGMDVNAYILGRPEVIEGQQSFLLPMRR